MPNTKSPTPTVATSQSNPGLEPRLISAQSADGAAPQFKIPFSAQAIQSVESVDLDLVLTTATGEKIILQQGALQAATHPDSQIVFQNGDSITAADQVKKLGILKPVEGGSFRLKSGDASPAVAEIVTGDGFGLGKELQDTMSQLTETSKQLEKVLQTLTTASLSTTTDESKPITAGPGTGTGVQKITPQSDKFASPSPGSPPQPEAAKSESSKADTADNTSNIKITNTARGLFAPQDSANTNVQVVDKIKTAALSAEQIAQGTLEVLKPFGEAALREMLPNDPLQVRVTGTDAVKLEPEGFAHNTLVLPGVLNAASVRLELPAGATLPDGFQINGFNPNSGAITVSTSSLVDLKLAIQWQVKDQSSSVTPLDFQIGVKYLDAKGVELDQGRAPITFTYGELRNLTDIVQLDGNSNTKIFLSAYGYNYSVKGDAQNNTISTGHGDDRLDGGEGADNMSGGAGDDTYVVDDTGDVVIEIAGEGIDTVQASVNATLSGNVENLSLTGAATAGTGNSLDNTLTANNNGNTLSGGAGKDTLIGGTSADTLDGGTGDDSMSGGTGDDIYIVDASGDTVTEAADAGVDTVQSAINYTLGDNLENLTLTGNATTGTGNGLDNTITASNNGNTLSGGAGKDTLMGGTGADTLDGGTGNDSMSGGTGDDIYIVDASGDAVTEASGAGVDTVQSAINYTLGDNVENLTLTLTGAATTGTGNSLDNTIKANNNGNTLSGGEGKDTLMGGTGADTLIGGAGGDLLDGGGGVNTASYADSIQAVTVNLLTGSGAGGDAAGDALVRIENLIGSDHNDTFISGAGPNSLNGAGGVDTVSYAGSTSAVTVNLLTGVGKGGNADGDALSNIENLIGSINADTFFSGAGANSLDGADGTDTVSYADSAYAVTVSLLTGAGKGGNAEGDTLSNIENLTGSKNNDTLTGDSGNNYLIGNAGNDSLIGGIGNDTLDGGVNSDSMIGGVGDDTYYVDVSSGPTVDVIIELLDEGKDTVSSSVNYTLADNLENLNLTGSASEGIGNSLDNTIIGSNTASTLNGSDGNDSIAGGTRNDTLIGGLGNDTLDGGAGSDGVDYSSATNNMTVELKGSKTSTVSFFINNVDQGTDTLSNIENIKTGSGNDQIFATGSGSIANTIYSGAGDDTVSAGDGDDTLYGGDGNDSLMGGGGNDTLDLRIGNTSLVGDSADGGAGDDKVIISQDTLGSNTTNLNLMGGAGSDTLIVYKGTSTASLDLSRLKATGFETLDLSSDTASNSVTLSSAGVQALLGTSGTLSVLKLQLGGNDVVEISSESNVYVNDFRASATFYSDAAKTQQIAQVIYA